MALGLGSPTSASAGDEVGIGIVGNEDILWAYERRAQEDGSTALRFAYRRASPKLRGRFLPLHMPPVTGRVASGLTHGVDLHIFFSDGTHRRYSPAAVPWSARPSAPYSVAISLPQSTLPVAVASDQAGAALYALVSAEVANAAAKPSAPEDEESADLDAGEREAAEYTAAPPESESRTATALVLNRVGAWTRDRDGPDDLTENGRVLQMLASNGTVHLLYQVGYRDSDFIHRISEAADVDWGRTITLPLERTPAMCSSGWVEGIPVLVIAEGDAAGHVVRTMHFTEDAWARGATLLDEANRTVFFSDPISVTLFGSHVAVATLGRSGQFEIGLWSLEDGKPLEQPTPVRPLLPRPKPAIGRSGRLIIQYTILTGVLGAIFVWRRDTVLRAAPLGPGQVPARLPYRAVALLIDLVILLPVWGTVIYYLWFPTEGGLTFPEYLQSSPSEMSEGMFWSSAIVGAIVGVYGTFFEALSGATPGKKVAGLSVVNEGGQRCRLRAIVIRNLARVIEFEFVPVALLVILTPNRQRLGDILARTVVVERAPQAPYSEPPPAE